MRNNLKIELSFRKFIFIYLFINLFISILFQTEFEQKKLCLKDDRIDDTKLQDQRDHLIMIREKDYIKATVEVWSAIPLNGSFNNNILSIQGSIKELQNILYSPSTSWNEYFEAKG